MVDVTVLGCAVVEVAKTVAGGMNPSKAVGRKGSVLLNPAKCPGCIAGGNEVAGEVSELRLRDASMPAACVEVNWKLLGEATAALDDSSGIGDEYAFE